MQPARRVRTASALALGFNIFGTAVKLAAAVLTGSVSILTESIHSGTDLLAAAISFVAIRFSTRDPDEDHPYGHGKFDSLAGFAEATLMLAFSIGGAAGAAWRLANPAPAPPATLGAYLVGGTALVAFGLSLRVGRVARESGSAALRSSEHHLRLDSFVSAGVAAAVFVGGRTGWAWLDPLVALGIAAFLVREGARLARRAFGEVVDERIEAEEIAKIHAVLATEPTILGHHRVRTRHSGPTHHVSLHIVLPDEMTVGEGHAIAHRIERGIEAALHPGRCVVHVDPASDADHED